VKLFKTVESIYAEISAMEKAEKFRREDRATVSEFYNGAPPLTDDEAADLGFTVNVSNLFGYTDVAQAKEQTFGMFTKPARCVQIELDAAPPGKRATWGLEASTEASRVLKKIKKFKPHYEGICGDGALHGEAILFHGTPTFPLPKQVALSKMLVPYKAPADPHRLTHWAIEDEIDLPDLARFWRKKAKGWDNGNLDYILKQIYEGKLQHGRQLDPENWEECEYERQTNSASSDTTKTTLSVYYFYQVRTDLDTNPIDLTILLKRKGEGPAERELDAAKRGLIYEKESCYPNVDACLHPFFSDCILGGAPLWHRVMGLGTLNYGLNHAVELLINRAMQGTIESTMNLWKAKDAITRDEIQQILLKHNGVIPENVELLPNRFPMDFTGVMGMIQFFRQQGSKNSRGTTPNLGDKNDQLEVQAIAEQNAGAATQNSRSSNWYDYSDRMWTEAVARLTNPFIEPQEAGYSEAMDFQGAMQRREIPLYWLQPHNTQVMAVRLIGDGLRSKELSVVQYLTANRSNYAPEVQPKITRICTALALDNYPLAEELTPLTEEEGDLKCIPPESENAIMLTQRVALKPHPADVDEIHVLTHFPALEQLISDGVQFQQASFTPQQLDAFHKIGTHTIIHIERIEGKAQNNKSDPQRQKAREFMNQMNQYAALAEKLQNNMQQAQGQQQPEPMSEADKAKLQMTVETLKLQRDKLTFSMEKFARTQGNREQAMAFEQMLKLQNDQRAEEQHRRSGAVDDTRLALDIHKTRHELAQPASA